MALFSGASNKREIQAIEKSLASYQRIGLSSEIGEKGLELLRKYAKSDGTGAMDALIAATAISGDMTLSTKNEKHFRNIDGLSLEVPKY